MNYLVQLENKRHSDGGKIRTTSVTTTATTSRQILKAIMVALEEEKFAEAVNLFANEFIFTDHALELEFMGKDRLTEFFQKTRELFPDTVVVVDTILECGDIVVAEWTLTATQSEPFWGGITRRIPIFLPGVSILQVENKKITRWTDYYDRMKSRRMGLAAVFQEVEY